jgi:hypothetical protein
MSFQSHIFKLYRFGEAWLIYTMGHFIRGYPMVRHELVLKNTSVIPEVSSSTSLEGDPLESSDPSVLAVSKIAWAATASLTDF